jgi:hypothetical protein
MAKLGAGPEAVAEKISKALSANRPNTRYKVTPSARVTMGVRRLVSDRMWDRMMRSQFSPPKPQA